MKVQPLSDCVLVRRCEPQDKTSGGILMPDIAKNVKPRLGATKGKVLQAGPGRLTDDQARMPMTVKAGDTVWFATHLAYELEGTEREEGKVFLLRLHDVLAVET
jgi:chaperonin GroES